MLELLTLMRLSSIKASSMLPMANPEDPPRVRFLYRTAFLVNVCLLSGMLSHDSGLRETLVQALHVALPSRVARPLTDILSNRAMYALPDKATVSRWRLLIDAALMLYMRECNLDGGPWFRYMMVDSSTQGGRDYELIICSSIRRDEVSSLRRDAHILIGLR
jgi:hypothetical protein